jgi:D-inositol-3-phosphate glycosyltransferase
VAAERRIAATADGLVVPSYREKRHLIELYGGDPERIDVIPCGVDMDHFRDRGRKRSRSRLNLDVDTAVILYVGRYAPVKGLAGLVDAMALIPEAVPLRLLVVGGDGLRDLAVRIVHDQVERLGLRNRIHFCGRIEPAELPDYYSAADFLVLPSHYESFGLVVLEALACGTPVLATPVGAVESIIEKGTNGMVIANPQSDTLAAGIVAMIERNRQRPPVRDAVRASVNGFTWDGVVRRIERLYRTVIG